MAVLPPEIERARRLTRTALLAAVALVLGFLETMIPLPGALPGMKLGLSNIAVIIALFLVDGKTAAKVAVFKVLATGFLFGSPLMMAYSAAGTALALGAMAGLKRLGVTVVAVSLVAAVTHNGGQLLVAAWFLGTWAVLLSAPFLLAAACVTGAATGLVAQRVVEALAGQDQLAANPDDESGQAARSRSVLAPCRAGLIDDDCRELA